MRRWGTGGTKPSLFEEQVTEILPPAWKVVWIGFEAAVRVHADVGRIDLLDVAVGKALVPFLQMTRREDVGGAGCDDDAVAVVGTNLFADQDLVTRVSDVGDAHAARLL